MVIDAGDVFGSSGLTAWLKATTAMDGMSLIGYDVHGLGDSELQFGLLGLEELFDRASFPTLSSNVTDVYTGEPYLPRHMTIQAGSARVAVTSAVAPAFVQPADLDDGHGRVLEVLDATSALIDAVAELRQDADVVVVMAHVGIDAATALADAVADTGGDIDILIVSHGGPLLLDPLHRGGTIIAAAGLRGQFIGRLDITLDAAGAVAAVAGGPVMLNESVPDDPALSALYQDYLDQVESAIDDILASIPEEVPPSGGSYIGRAACTSCHPNQSTQWLTTPHAQAFSSLLGVNQEFDPECTVCHTTGFGYLGGFRLLSVTPGLTDVQCESCHGAGAAHVADPQLGYGLTAEATCRTCHEAARFPDWDYATARPQILHTP